MSTTQFIQSLLKWLASPGQYASQLGAAIRSAGDLWSSTETQSKLDEKISGIREGENVTIDVSDPYNPKINAIGTGFGDMNKSVYDPTGVEADAFDRANHHGDIAAGDINGLATVATTGAYSDLSGAPTLATVATSGDYDDLSNKPTLGTAAAADTGDFATAAQGGLADSAVQPGDIADMLETTDIGVSVQAYDADTAKTDVAQQFSKPQWASATALTSGTTVTPDLADNNDFTLTLGHNATLANPSNQSTHVNQKGTITITQDGTGGRTLSFGSNWKAIGSASAPSINTTAGVTSCIDYHVLSSTVIRYSLRAVGAA